MTEEVQPKAQAFVIQAYQPADVETKTFLTEYAKGVLPRARATSVTKLVNILADLVQAATKAPDGFIAWSVSGEEFKSAIYGQRLSRQLRDELIKLKVLEKVRSPKIRTTKTVYKVKLPFENNGLAFKRHSHETNIEVRTPAQRGPLGKIRGKKLSGREVSQLPGYSEVSAKISQINNLLKLHPLARPDGKVWDNVTRKFMNGSLKSGGRLYAQYQSLNQKQRLTCTIDSSPLIEIDIIASYVYLMNAGKESIGSDPYSKIAFVRNEPTEEGRKLKRKAAKSLVSALFWHGDTSRSRFPIVKKDSKSNKIISFKEKFNIPVKVKYEEYEREIIDALPFLSRDKIIAIGGGPHIMFQESEIIVNTMISLSNLTPAIPTYPVHDCLLAKAEDEDIVVAHLHNSMKSTIGSLSFLKIEYYDGRDSKIVNSD